MTYQLRPRKRLINRLSTRYSPIHTHPTQRLEAIISQHVDAAMVRLEVVDLLAEDEEPEVFADELDAVEWGLGAGFVC